MCEAGIVHLESKTIDTTEGLTVTDKLFSNSFRATDNKNSFRANLQIEFVPGHRRPAALLTHFGPQFGVTGIVRFDGMVYLLLARTTRQQGIK